MKIMGKKTFSNLQRVNALKGNQKLHILLPTMLFLLLWVIFSVACVVSAAEYDASDVDKPPKLVRQMPPKYPPEAKRHKTEGRVVVRCLITAKGKADRMEIVESEPAGVFDESALKAIKYWQFRPGVLKGEMVDTWVKIPLSFEP
jgi:TonB family protein